VYECAAAPDIKTLRARAVELHRAGHDRNQLACAADLMFRAANLAATDVELNLHAMLLAADYIDHVNTLWDFDLYGVRVPEWTARLDHAVPQGEQLASRLTRLASHEPAVLAGRALFALVASARTADAKTQLTTARQAIEMLQEATAREPGVLDGNALLALGRLYYDLPEFAGGDPVKALQALEAALQIAPTQPSLIRYLAYVYEQERQREQAQAVLSRILAVTASNDNLQLLADELRNARDLASRMQNAALEQQLNRKRESLLQAHPELLTRTSSAANMHGGVDPITGKPH
jgi:uncharacterized protein HemY